MCSTRDPALLEETKRYVLNESRDQDLLHFSRGLQGNTSARRMFVALLKDNYDTVRLRVNDGLKWYANMSIRSASASRATSRSVVSSSALSRSSRRRRTTRRRRRSSLCVPPLPHPLIPLLTPLPQDKDTSKYDMSLAQALDSIKARYTYIGRSTEDLKQWLDEWQSKQ